MEAAGSTVMIDAGDVFSSGCGVGTTVLGVVGVGIGVFSGATYDVATGTGAGVATLA
jgi:hypothetical protein